MDSRGVDSLGEGDAESVGEALVLGHESDLEGQDEEDHVMEGHVREALRGKAVLQGQE